MAYTFFEESFAEVTYSDESGIIFAKMDTYEEGEQFRRYMNSIIDALERTQTDRMISNSSEIPPLAQDDQAWSVTDWVPRAEDAGLEHMALIVPESAVSEMSVKNVVEQANDSINRDMFANLDSARQWVAQQ